ncbi:MAG: iron ABC transporter permease [Bacteroidota bacterium]
MAIVFLTAIPLAAIFLRLFDGPGESWQHIVDTVLPDYISNSLWLITGCVLGTFLLGVSCAWIISRYKIPLQSTLEWLLILPLSIPSYITAYAYSGFLDYNGSLSRMLDALGLPYTRIDIMNLGGLVFVLSISLFPYVYLASRAMFVFQSGRLLEAAKLLGHSERRSFFKIVLPMARPAIVGGLLLVVMEVLNDYGAAHYFGVNTFTTGIFRTWFSLEEPETAIFLCALLLVIVFLFISIERWTRKNKKYFLATRSQFILSKKVPAKSKRILFGLLLGTPVFLGFLVPVGQLVYWAVLTFDRVASDQLFLNGMQSLLIAAVGALLTVLVALLMIYFPKWNRLRILKRSAQVTTLGYAIPGAVLAIGVMIPSLKLDNWIIETVEYFFGTKIGFVLNGTMILLVYAYVIRFLAVGFQPINSNNEKIGIRLNEASRMLGKKHFFTLRRIDIPLLKPALIGAFILVFIDTMKELPLTLILKPYDFNTLAVKAYEYASDELVMEAALPSLMIILIGVIPIIFLNYFMISGQQPPTKNNHISEQQNIE